MNRNSWSDDELDRISDLDRAIKLEYGELAPDELAILTASFDDVRSLLCETIRISKQKCWFGRVDELEPPFRAVVAPDLVQWLRPHDVFYGTFGRRNGGIHLICIHYARV